ncbi:MAG: hypothetical protein MJE66_07355 [Proteobacteria bacterium]|nr:hypothetical protein [Pseudomonadota bacterium]
MRERGAWPPELAQLSALGFGPEALLMNEPRLFLDGRFLGAIQTEFAEELEAGEAGTVLFQIGFVHGLRDATRVVHGHFDAAEAGHAPCAPPPLAIALGARSRHAETGSLEIVGSWPEGHEAESYTTALGPATTTTCLMSAGYTSGWLSGQLEADVVAQEIECRARGDAECRFVAREVALWRQLDVPEVCERIQALPFQALRQHVFQRLAQPPKALDAPALPPEAPALDPAEPAVHIWGPVMVLPFAHPDDMLRAVDLLGRDPGASAVRVVVIDLRGAVLDEGFGAAALEQVLDAVETWGADGVLAGISPLSEPAIRDLEASHLVIHKDLPEAIGAAFQIANLQRRTV